MKIDTHTHREKHGIVSCCFGEITTTTTITISFPINRLIIIDDYYDDWNMVHINIGQFFLHTHTRNKHGTTSEW